MIEAGKTVVLTKEYIDTGYLSPLGRDAIHRALVARGTVLQVYTSEFGRLVAEVEWKQGRELYWNQPITSISPCYLKEIS